ncbi:MAG: hypothetical protein WD066_09960 [Planctomycetaceae bacterium]
MARHHPNKAINAAIEYAMENGWRFVKSGPRAHAYGKLYCPARERGACLHVVYGTPTNPEKHARQIRWRVDHCPHCPDEDAEEE